MFVHWLKPARYFLQGAFYRGWAGLLLRGGVRHFTRHTGWSTWAKVLSLLNGITCIIPVLAPCSDTWLCLNSRGRVCSGRWHDGHRGTDVVFVYFKRNAPCAPAASDKPRENSESLLNRFFSAVLLSPPSAFRWSSPSLIHAGIADGNHGFWARGIRHHYALTAGVSMTVSFSTPFALGILSHVRWCSPHRCYSWQRGSPCRFTFPCGFSVWYHADLRRFSVGFGVAMSQALGPFSLRAA